MQPSRAVIALASKNSVGSETAARRMPNQRATWRAGERPLGDSHMPPAVVTKTRLESLGWVRERKSYAVAETERARAFIPPPVTRRPRGRLAGLKVDAAATAGRSSRARGDWQAAPRREQSGGSSSPTRAR